MSHGDKSCPYTPLGYIEIIEGNPLLLRTPEWWTTIHHEIINFPQLNRVLGPGSGVTGRSPFKRGGLSGLQDYQIHFLFLLDPPPPPRI